MTYEQNLYIKTSLFSILLFGLFYGYMAWLGAPNTLNKAFADTAITLMGLSMIVSGLAYFFNFFKPMLEYRKHVGLIGFVFLIGHIVLSFSTLLLLFNASTWTSGKMWPALTGLLATIIFTIMAAISNRFFARVLGGTRWKLILRTGYIALFLAGVHVILLKSARWIPWYQGGMKTSPSLSLIVTVVVALVLLMRIVLWIALKTKNRK